MKTKRTPSKKKPTSTLTSEQAHLLILAPYHELISRCYAIGQGRQLPETLNRYQFLEIARLLESLLIRGEEIPVHLRYPQSRGASSKANRDYWIAVDFELRKARGEKYVARYVSRDWRLSGEDTVRKTIAPHRREARAKIEDFRSHKRGADYGLRQLAKMVFDKCAENRIKTKSKNRKK
jgi:hypothetical protein